MFQQGRVLVTVGKGAAGPRTEVYIAEIMGAAAGFEAAVNSSALPEPILTLKHVKLNIANIKDIN